MVKNLLIAAYILTVLAISAVARASTPTKTTSPLSIVY